MFSLATLPLWALDHQGSLDKHLDFSDDCEEPLPSTSGQTSQRRGGVPAPMETVTLLVPHQQGLTTPGPHFLRKSLMPEIPGIPSTPGPAISLTAQSVPARIPSLGLTKYTPGIS